MTFDPPLRAAQPVPPHASAAFFVLVVGAVQLVVQKGGAPHRALGWTWIALVVFVAASSFFVTGIGGAGRFSYIRAFTAIALLSLWAGLRAIRRENRRKQGATMACLFLRALVIARASTLALGLGRLLHGAVFGAPARRRVARGLPRSSAGVMTPR